MPDEIQELFNLDYKTLLSSLVIFMVGWVALKTLLDKFSSATGIEFPWAKREHERDEKLSELEGKVEVMEGQIDTITESVSMIKGIVDTISSTVADLTKRQDANEAAKLKDRISQGYRYYHNLGQWTEMDKESYKDLIAAYTQYSQNSFVHEICEKEMETWEVVEKINFNKGD